MPAVDDPAYFQKRGALATAIELTGARRAAGHMFCATLPMDDNDYMDDSREERQRCHEIAAGVLGVPSRYI
jgi:hypothetical protein